MPTNVVVSAQFNQDAHKLKKRYAHVFEDVALLREVLLAGQLPGKRIQGLPYNVYKVRIPNRDARRGKRGGYRIVYYIQQAEQIALITIFTKSDKSDVPLEVLRRMIQEYERQS